MKLHEAMVTVLRESGREWMDRDEIAREIERRDLYRRPSDGLHPPSDQIRLRARSAGYRHLFECSDTACSRVRLRRSAVAPMAVTRPARAPRDGAPAAPPVAASTRPPPQASAWYDELREHHRPTSLRVLLIGESPPHPGAGQRRFFYAPTLTIDNLYRGVAEALYGDRGDVDIAAKPRVLDQMQADGVWLIDAVETPVNQLGAAERARALRAAVPGLVERCQALQPERGVIICHGKLFAAAAAALRAEGVPVLHDDPLPFPLGNWRAEFVRGVRDALGAGGVSAR